MSRKPAADGAVPGSPQEAFRTVVYAYGARDMAAALMMNLGTLHNKCHADEDSHHKPTLQDVVNVTRVSGDTRILESLDRLFGRAGYDLAPGDVSDVALIELLCKISGEHGQMHQAVLSGLQFERFTIERMQLVRAEAFDVINAILNFVQRMEGLVDADE